MKKISIILLSLLAIQCSFAQNSDAEFLKLKKEYTLNPDGSIVFNVSKQVKLLSHFAFHRLYGETFIVYNEDYQELTINKAFTVMADGKKVVTPQNAFNKVLPRFAANAPAFNNLREMVVTHTGLEVGAIINLDYTIRTASGFYNGLMIDELLQESSPVNDLEIVVNVPSGKVLNYSLLNYSDSKPSIIKGKKIDTYTWKFSNIKASSKDRYQPEHHLCSPTLFASTVSFNMAMSDFAGQKAIMQHPDKELESYVNEIIGNETNPLKKALLVQKYVVKNIKTNNTPIIYRGNLLRTSMEVWQSNYGVPAEKAVLLSNMLKLAGINCMPVVAVANKYLNKEIGDPSNYKEFFVVADIPKYGDLYLSPIKVSAQNSEFMLDGFTIIYIDPNAKSPEIATVKSVENKMSMKGSIIVLDSAYIDGKLVLELSNGCAPYLSMINNSNYLNGTISGEGNANVVENKKLKKNMIEVEMELKSAKGIQENGGYYSMVIPYVNKGVSSWHYTNLVSERNAPLQIPYIIDEYYDFVFVIPDNMIPINKSADFDIDNAVGSVKIIYQRDGNEVHVKREISFKKQIVPVNEYNDFKKLMDIWNTKKYQSVTFKKKEVVMEIMGQERR